MDSPTDHTRWNRRLDGGYILEADGTIGFRVAQRDPRATLVIDPTISLVYSSFLGVMGNEMVGGVAADSSGKVYIAGTTTSPSTFPESASATTFGPGIPASTGSTSTAREFFIAKVDPAQSGTNSLVYLTFLGGSTDQAGGLIAVDAAGDAVITGTTTSADYPVTDSSSRTTGSNDTSARSRDMQYRAAQREHRRERAWQSAGQCRDVGRHDRRRLASAHG
jgi:hypothetical protein